MQCIRYSVTAPLTGIKGTCGKNILKSTLRFFQHFVENSILVQSELGPFLV